MANKIRSILFPTPEEQKKYEERYLKLWKDLAKKKGCATCSNCIHVISYPGFVTGEECVCGAGLECDTVLFTVKNCPQWKEVELLNL